MARPRISSSTHLSCPVCYQNFGRQEHLTRHVRIHTHEKPYKCSHCDKRFSRLDVLTRHRASHEQQSETPAIQVSSRACKQCALDRVRCSRSLPCKRCFERDLSCSYPTSRRALATGSEGEHNRQSLLPSPGTTCVLDGTITTNESSCPEPQLFSPAMGNTARTLAASDAPGNLVADSTVWIDPFGDLDGLCEVNLPSLGPLEINWISPGHQYNLDWGLLPQTFEVGSQVQHLNEEAVQIPVSDAQLEGNERLQQTIQTAPASNTAHTPNSSRSTATPKCVSGEYYVSGDGPRAPFGGRYHARGSVASSRTLQARSNDETAAFHGTESSSSASCCSIEAYDNLFHAAIHEVQVGGLPLDTVQFPSYEQVQSYVEQYFNKFHPIFPFLRQTSFEEVDSGESLLLLAVALVGCRYAKHCHELSNMLSQILDAALRRRKSELDSGDGPAYQSRLYVPGQRSNKDTFTDIRILQAGILNLMCLLQSGKQTSLERALNERMYLVQTCISQGLLDHEPDEEVSCDTCDDGLLRWLSRESEIRTGMMIWFLDSKITYEFDESPLMDIDDVKTTLPSCEDIWECPLLLRQGKRKFPALTLLGALEMLYIEKRLPSELSEFSSSLIIHAIYRNTKKMLLRTTRLDFWVPSATAETRNNSLSTPNPSNWLPLTSIASKWRNSACDSLDILHWHANSKVARFSGSEHHTILQLHLARIIILTPTQCIKSLTWQLTSKPLDNITPLDRLRLSSARTELLQWVVRDRYKARLAVVHCAALYWHVRRYSCDSIQEPFAIYIATLVLWAFCLAMQFPEVIEATTNEEESSPEPSFCHLDRPLDDELVQLFVRTGHKMCPNISKVGNILQPQAAPKVLREGHHLLTVGSQASTNCEHSMGVTTYAPCFTWGVEESYATALETLVGVTTGREANMVDQADSIFPWSVFVDRGI